MLRAACAILAGLALLALAAPRAGAAETIRVGALKFGTVDWELDTIKKNGLDTKNGTDLAVVPFAGGEASDVALQAGAVDVIVTDWLWVSRQRSTGADLTFVPYSATVGAIMVAADSPIRALADLKGRKLGVAGGPLDKSWLLIQGMAHKNGIDLAASNTIVYGAPPLLSEKLRQGELDAALDFWQFNARLAADGFRPIVSAEQAADALGASGPVSQIGYVFHEGWADSHKAAVLGFIRASRQAKALLKSSDQEWLRLHEDGLIKDGGKTLASLRDAYRAGIPSRPIADEEADAEKLYHVLATLGGEKLVGKARSLAPGTYWSAAKNDF